MQKENKCYTALSFHAEGQGRLIAYLSCSAHQKTPTHTHTHAEGHGNAPNTFRAWNLFLMTALMPTYLPRFNRQILAKKLFVALGAPDDSCKGHVLKFAPGSSTMI